MALLLVQHGKSLPKEVDPERGLSAEGRAETERIAKVAKNCNVNVSAIFHSGKTRAAQTAGIFASALLPQGAAQARTGLAPMDDVEPVATEMDSLKNLMLVGHLPFMEKLASHLLTGASKKTIVKFQNSGIVCLDQNEKGDWFVRWMLQPEIY